MPWLWSFAIFTVWRALALIFFAIVNDLYFAYNVIMVLLWTIFCVLSIYGWAVVYSLFLELVDLTKLEDLAHLRVRSLSYHIWNMTNEYNYLSRWAQWLPCTHRQPTHLQDHGQPLLTAPCPPCPWANKSICHPSMGLTTKLHNLDRPNAAQDNPDASHSNIA